MPHYSATSHKNLAECTGELRRLFNEVIRHWDCSIIEGHRGEDLQNKYYEAKPRLSFKKWPDSKHNSRPSRAVHAAPYPIDWEDEDRFRQFGFFVLGAAAVMGIRIIWGGDWDRDYDTTDQKFHDLAHFEEL